MKVSLESYVCVAGVPAVALLPLVALKTVGQLGGDSHDHFRVTAGGTAETV